MMVNYKRKVRKMQCNRTMRSHRSIVFSQLLRKTQTILYQLPKESWLRSSTTYLPLQSRNCPFWRSDRTQCNCLMALFCLQQYFTPTYL